MSKPRATGPARQPAESTDSRGASPSWNDGAAGSAILDFIARVTEEGGTDYAEREYAYAGASATDSDAERILDTASRLGWTVVSMRREWNRVFAG